MHLYTLRTEEVEDDLTTKIIAEAELKYIHDINDKINNAKTAKDLDKIFDEHIDYISKTHTVTKNGKTYKYKLIDNETFLLEELNPIDDIIKEKKNKIPKEIKIGDIIKYRRKEYQVTDINDKTIKLIGTKIDDMDSKEIKRTDNFQIVTPESKEGIKKSDLDNTSEEDKKKANSNNENINITKDRAKDLEKSEGKAEEDEDDLYC